MSIYIKPSAIQDSSIDQSKLDFTLPWANGSGYNSAVTRNSGCTATGEFAISNGRGCEANEKYSHAEGLSTQTTNEAEHAEGKYNASHSDTISSVGFGRAGNRKNALEIMNNGNVFIYGVGNYDGTNPSSATPVKEVIDNTGKLYVHRVTYEYFDSLLNKNIICKFMFVNNNPHIVNENWFTNPGQKEPSYILKQPIDTIFIEKIDGVDINKLHYVTALNIDDNRFDIKTFDGVVDLEYIDFSFVEIIDLDDTVMELNSSFDY